MSIGQTQNSRPLAYNPDYAGPVSSQLSQEELRFRHLHGKGILIAAPFLSQSPAPSAPSEPLQNRQLLLKERRLEIQNSFSSKARELYISSHTRMPPVSLEMQQVLKQGFLKIFIYTCVVLPLRALAQKLMNFILGKTEVVPAIPQQAVPDISQFIRQDPRHPDSCYIDMGQLYGNYITTQCIDWWPEPVSINQAKADHFLGQLFNQLQKDGVNKIELSFSQICDIENLFNHHTGCATDTITQIFKDGYPVGTTGKDFLKYFNSKANSFGIKVDLSFGGAIATPDNMKLQGSPVDQATKLAAFMDEYGIDLVDFDLEGGPGLEILKVNKPEDVVLFFKTLHDLISTKGKESILTVDGSLGDGPGGGLKILFDHFNQLFHGVNLMLYSTEQYYLDADNVTWGISQWLSYIKDPAKIHFGFYDSIHYEDPASSAGDRYDVTGLTRGQAAASIYLQVLHKLNLTPEQMGEPFWWTDIPQTLISNQVLVDFRAYLDQRSSQRQLG